jgi:hypothetical protein
VLSGGPFPIQGDLVENLLNSVIYGRGASGAGRHGDRSTLEVVAGGTSLRINGVIVRSHL